MKMKTLGIGAAGLASGVAAVLIAGAVGGSSESAGRASPANAFPTNGRGMTYGSGLDAETPPDLVAALGDAIGSSKLYPARAESLGDHKISGYILYSDLIGPMPSSPEEAIKLSAQSEVPRTIPLYAEDGVTVIGEFTLQPAEVAD